MESAWIVFNKISATTRSLGNWAYRHRRKLIATAVISGSSYLFYRYVKNKMLAFQEFQHIPAQGDIPFQKLRMQQYFSNSQKRCDSMLLNKIIPDLQEKLFDLVPIPSKDELRQVLKGTKEEKVEMWGKAKILSFTRTIVSIYSACLMTLFLRVEVNILGRYLYMDSTLSDSDSSAEDEKPIPADVQQKYLSFASSGYVQEKGLETLVSFIQERVSQELASWPLTKKCTITDIETILSNIRDRIEKDANAQDSKFSDFVLQNNLMPNLQLQVLVTETRDVLESKQFESILKSCLDQGFAILVNQLRSSFEHIPNVANTPESNSSTTNDEIINGKTNETNGTKVETLTLAKVSALIKKQSKHLLQVQDTIAPTFMKTLFDLKELEEYSYYIFTSSYDHE